MSGLIVLICSILSIGIVIFSVIIVLKDINSNTLNPSDIRRTADKIDSIRKKKKSSSVNSEDYSLFTETPKAKAEYRDEKKSNKVTTHSKHESSEALSKKYSKSTPPSSTGSATRSSYNQGDYYGTSSGSPKITTDDDTRSHRIAYQAGTSVPSLSQNRATQPYNAYHSNVIDYNSENSNIENGIYPDRHYAPSNVIKTHNVSVSTVTPEAPETNVSNTEMVQEVVSAIPQTQSEASAVYEQVETEQPNATETKEVLEQVAEPEIVDDGSSSMRDTFALVRKLRENNPRYLRYNVATSHLDFVSDTEAAYILTQDYEVLPNRIGNFRSTYIHEAVYECEFTSINANNTIFYCKIDEMCNILERGRIE